MDVIMNIEEALIQRMRTLPVARQVEVLDFADFLSRKSTASRTRRNPIGLFAGLGVDISTQDIEDTRLELWKCFPRDIEL